MSNQSIDKIMNDEEEDYLQQNRACSSDEDKKVTEIVSPVTLKKTSAFTGYGSKIENNSENNSEKIEIKETIVIKEDKKNDTMNENQIINNNSFYKPSDMSSFKEESSKNKKDINSNSFKAEESSHAVNFQQSGFGGLNDRSSINL